MYNNSLMIVDDSMESSSSSSSSSSLDYLNLFLLRPILAIAFVLSLVLLGWFLAWKLVLVHVPLVQEIFGLRKKPTKPKPPSRRRFSRFYNSIDAQISNSQCSERELNSSSHAVTEGDEGILSS
ncbi:uncharacterized protein LOC130758451 isoform X2 [Actinidia eriantha]|uniref:uncharacterized protein LOC130758451 isoform X2 n=1 Tax=Actinidia eriantha TaxID=165200 RepID=UPI00258FFFF5|nr:uncharacterized protein LOC130758451 isoform X2 [Actinidia eriantha]